MSSTQVLIARELYTLWQRVPSLRFCQLVANITGPADTNYYMSDETFLRKLRESTKVLIGTTIRAAGVPVVDQFCIDEVTRYEIE